MSEADKWNQRYRSRTQTPPTAARVLRDNLHLVPKSGRALDLAAGLGANALLLAQQGLESHAWDISNVALESVVATARQVKVTVHCTLRDVVAAPPEAESFDLITVSHFLERAICPDISRALTPGGLLFYQTYSVDSSEGPRNPAFLLQRNELLRLFSGLEIIYYREEGMVFPSGSEAMLIARRPSES